MVLAAAGIGYLMRPAVTIKMDNQPGAGAAACSQTTTRSAPVPAATICAICGSTSSSA